MRNFYGYTRVSTLKQGEHGVSLEQQHEAIQRYADKASLKIACWFTEHETAAKRGRPVFGQMLKLLRAGKASGVIIHKIDRSARNLKDWADLGELIDSGIDVHFANESLDLHSRGGRLSADIQAVVAADYIRNLREETKKGFYGRLKQGLFPRPAPVGYQNQGPGKLKLLDPVQVPLVRQAFELYATGKYNLRQLSDLMFSKGLRTHKGGKVKQQPMAKLLSNSFYTGIIKIRKTAESFQGNHEPIVPMQLYSRVQDVLTGKTHRKVIKHDFLFRQIFTCKPCQRCLVPERQKTYIYYRCHGKGYPSAMQREERLETAIIEKLKLLEFSQEEKHYFKVKLLNMQQSWQGQQQALVQGLELKLAQLQERFNRLTDAFLDQSLDKQTFEQRKTALLEERCLVQNQLKELQTTAKPLPEKLTELLELAGSAYLAYKAAEPEEKRELLKILSSNRTLNGESLEIMLKLPYQLVAEREKSFHGCARRAEGRDVATVWDALLPSLVHAMQAV